MRTPRSSDRLLRIREFLGSHLSPDIDYPEILRSFPQLFQAKFQDTESSFYTYILTKSLWHKSSYHLNYIVCSAQADWTLTHMSHKDT
jgi:hypothetical protein